MSRSPNGPAARANIGGCAACHDQSGASHCVQCHRVGGVGGNPYPMGWTARHGTEEIDRSTMCLLCHR